MPFLRSTSLTAIIGRRAPRVPGGIWQARRGHRGEWDWFLAVAFPDVQLQILPYNRVVQDLAGMTPDAFLSTLRAAIHRQGWPGIACAARGSRDVSGRRLAHHRAGRRRT